MNIKKLIVRLQIEKVNKEDYKSLEKKWFNLAMAKVNVLENSQNSKT